MAATTKITVRSPFDGTVLGEVPASTADDVDRAVRLASRAVAKEPLPAWRRSEILAACSQMVTAHQDDLAGTIAAEAAKPIGTARTETQRAASTIALAAVEAQKLGGDIVPVQNTSVGEGKLAYTIRLPRGVIGAISPFNFPLNLVAHKVAPAIAAGCPVILKPAEQTPLSALALAEAFYACGLPREWLQVVTGDGETAGNALVTHPDVSYISFTGSGAVGWELPKRAPKKHVGLELGNSTPVIIETESDWHKAAKGVAAGGFSHAGQSCISVQRVYIHSAIAEQFTDYLVELVRALKVGDPMDAGTNVSSLIDSDAQERVSDWIREAVSQGAKLLCGGEIVGPFLTPAVLTNTTLDMKVCNEEVFGPVVTIESYDTLDQAIALANGTRYGLQAAIFTNDISSAMSATRTLEFGGVLVNETPTWRADVMPYGGVKDSGNTKEGPAYAIRSMTEERLVVISS